MQLHRFRFRAMASEHELQIYGSHSEARRVAQAAIADVQRIEAKYSRYLPESVTSRINRAAGGRAVAIDAETVALLRYADVCHTLSGGAFDITSGVLRQAWDFKRKPPHVPSPDELEPVLARIGWTRVEWNDGSIRLPTAGMEIDFGGIGKEYAADRVITICVEAGHAHCLCNLGGDVRAGGPQADGLPWRVGIRHPRQDDAAIALVALEGGAVATSGDYERFFEVEGRRYCHILDPRTGMPVTEWQSVSVIAPLCVVAGSCATIAMLSGGSAEAFLQQQGHPYVAVHADGSVRLRGVLPAEGVKA
jgi:FAD:protein FMN transferase